MTNNEEEKPSKNQTASEEDVRIVTQEELQKLKERSNNYLNSTGQYQTSNSWNVNEIKERQNQNKQIEQILERIDEIYEKIDRLEAIFVPHKRMDNKKEK